MHSKPIKLLVALIIGMQLSLILGTVYSNEKKLKEAKEIIVKLAPKDPRSLLQGDYVILNYEISRGAEKWLRAIKNKKVNKVKVVLSKQNEIYIFDSLYTPTQNITLQKDQVIMNGKVKKQRHVYFGIENFFVEEGTGLEVERNANFAKLKVTSTGDAFITELLEKVPGN